MTNVNVDNELYEQVKEFIKIECIDYPSINNFVERAVKDKLRIEKIKQIEQDRGL